jgi:predicted DsbA family dithiol-disulfide isomerase
LKSSFLTIKATVTKHYPRLIEAAAALTLFASSAAAANIPWDRIPDARGLSDPQRAVVTQVLQTGHSYGGCDTTFTLLRCLDADDPIAMRLANFVARRAAANRPAADILSSLNHRKLSAFPVRTFAPDLAGLVPSGNPDAPIRVVIYADFTCSYCVVAAQALRELSIANPDLFSLWFKNYPLAQDVQAIPAARAYLAAVRQGKGWEMHDELFAHSEALDDRELEACAQKAGVDLDQYYTDVTSDVLEPQIKAEKAEGVSFGVHKTPGIFINGKPFLGIKTKVELLDRIEEERDLRAASTKIK